MKAPAVTHRTKTILILSALLLGLGGSVAAQSGTQDQVLERAQRIFAAQTGPDQVTLAWDEVPGATEYRIYLPDPNKPGPPAPGTRPTMSLGGSTRRAIVTGVSRMANGAYLEAFGQGVVLYRGTFNAIARAPLALPTAPAAVQARETGQAEVTLSWNPVPGATAYMVLRTVRGSGWQMLCDICPPSGEFVDTTVVPGLEHTYMVAAIFPMGISTRTQSNALTVGAAQLAAATASTPTAAVWSKPMSTGTPVAGTAADNTNVGASAGTPTTGTATPTGTTTTTTGPTTGTTTTGAGTTTPSTGSTSNPCTPVVAPKTGTSTIFTKLMASGTPVAGTDADNTNVGASAGTPTSGSTGGCPTRTGTGFPTGTGTPTGTGPGSAEYQKGKSLNPGATGYPELWDPVATASGMTSDERVAAWKEIGIVALEYKHILGRQPTPDETRRDVAALKACTTWKQLWRQLAHSAERDTRFGYWAAAPLEDPLQAQKDFGLAVPPWTSQQCFGGLGPKCDGGIPDWPNDKVGPRWFGIFYMPDNTQLAYVEIGVAVGSILHDNACLKNKSGLNCNGYDLLGDATKIWVLPAALEWNKAAWNVIDQRTWRQTFGPYPTNLFLREFNWYDDLRPATPRAALMAATASFVTVPVLTLKPTGGETQQTRALQAPTGTSLDDTDVAFCSARAFGSTGWFIGKASWGICK